MPTKFNDFGKQPKAKEVKPSGKWYPFNGEVEEDGFVTVYISAPVKQG